MNVVIREYGLLGVAAESDSDLDCAYLTESAWQWLFEYSLALEESDDKPMLKPIHRHGKRWLQVLNYVGVIQTPCGTTLEIVPKIYEKETDIVRLRQVLLKMISASLNIPFLAAEQAHLQTFRQPLIDCLVSLFLRDAERLIKRGIRFEYNRYEESAKFIRGQLQVSKQLRRRPGQQHEFDISHDLYTPDRPENRVLRFALEKVMTFPLGMKNKRLANELLWGLESIPSSKKPELDLTRWKDNRLMAHYRNVKPWCELIVRSLSPVTQLGGYRGISLLFPMERLFESYLAHSLRNQLVAGFQLREQIQPASLCWHKNKPWFRLKPDIGIYRNDLEVILDAKWKRPDSGKANAKDKYNLIQTDFYQLFAYSQQCLKGQGDVFLIYPKTDTFQKPLPPFYFGQHIGDGPVLWIVPFDLDTEHLVPGEWCCKKQWYKSDSHQPGAFRACAG